MGWEGAAVVCVVVVVDFGYCAHNIYCAAPMLWRVGGHVGEWAR